MVKGGVSDNGRETGLPEKWLSTRKPLDLADDEAFPRALHNGLGYFFQRIDFEDSLHLREQAVQQPEVATRDPDNGSDGLLVQRVLREMHTPGGAQRWSNNWLISCAAKGRNSWTKPMRE